MLAPVMNAFFMVSCSPNVQGGLAAALSVLRVVSSMPAARRRARAEHRRRQRDVDAPPVIAALVDEIAGFIGLRGEVVIDRCAAMEGLRFLRLEVVDERHAPELRSDKRRGGTKGV